MVRNRRVDRDHGTPFCEPRAELKINRQSFPQSVEPFRDLLARKTGQLLGAFVYLNAGNDTRVVQHIDKEPPVLGFLANRLVVENRAADRLAKAGSRHDQFTIGPPRRLGLRNAEGGEPLMAGRIAFVHGQQTFVPGQQRFPRWE